MQAKGTSVTFTEPELFGTVHALAKAAAYEFENWRYIKNKPLEEVDEFVQFMTRVINGYERNYINLVRKLCRARARQQGGAYRKMTMDEMHTAERLISQSAIDAVSAMIKAAWSIKEQAAH